MEISLRKTGRPGGASLPAGGFFRLHRLGEGLNAPPHRPIAFKPVRGIGAIILGLLMSVATAATGTREVYVWQRQMGAEVASSLRSFEPQIDGCCVLAAEAAWSGGKLRIVRVPLDYATLGALGKPVGLALRIGPHAGPFAADDATARTLGDLAAELIAQARAAGLEVAELQVDFDAAESKLAGYRTWLGALRAKTGRTPLVFTALPSWLKQRDAFRALARAADGFVLQVHSLEKPANPSVEFTLCDPARARVWVRQAGEAGVPFRVALPTYGYVLAFNAAGKFLALAAEGPSRPWPVGTVLRAVRADAVAMGALARSLQEEPAPYCTGVIWFRLPVAGDRMNWDAITLATILRGEIPRRQVGVAAVWTGAGLAEIVLTNEGTTTEALPGRVELRWPAEARMLASDGLGGFFLETRRGEAQGIVRAPGVPADAALAPGRKMTIAWLRFAHDVSLDVSLPAPP